MSLTLLIVFITAVLAGLGFWFYNRRQINSLTETIEDKNMVIQSFRDHLSPQNGDVSVTNSIAENPSIVVEDKPEKKKKKYYNNQKKDSKGTQTKQQPKQNTEKNNRPKPRKPKTQQ